MAGRRSFVAIIALALALHALGMARSALPAQDGLKFLRVARAFQTRPWSDVVRSSDQHPLYPALVALTEPAVAPFMGHGPDAWRVAAQLVSALAAVALLVPLHGLTRTLFDGRIALLATLGFVLLPLPMAVGHDTLSDPLALCAFVGSMWLGLVALRGVGWVPAVGCGLVAGLGFLTRPEVLVVPLAVAITGLSRGVRPLFGSTTGGTGGSPTSVPRPSSTGGQATSATLGPPPLQEILDNSPLAPPKLGARLAALGIAFLAVVGSYALVKGEVSEKLALRLGAVAGRPVSPNVSREAVPWMPPGLDDPRWDFSPKEEPAEVPKRGVATVVRDLGFQWAEGLGWVLVIFAVWGLVRDGYIRGLIAGPGGRPDPDNTGRRLLAVYLVVFTLILGRHELRMGYLSGRHVLTLVIVSLPWAAAGVFVCARGLALKLGLGTKRARLAGLSLLTLGLAVSATLQAKPSHPSRWGHLAAARWLSANARPGESVLDTRGWAAFVWGGPCYDYWHVRQAFTDASLSYVVVGADELSADSPRGRTLRAVLAYAAEPVASFPGLQGGHTVGVRVFRFDRPGSWEGLRP